MTQLDHIVPSARLVELDWVDIAVPPAVVWENVRHDNLARSALVRAFFAMRTLPDRFSNKKVAPGGVRLDELSSSRERPGFQILVDDAPREVTVGAIGKLWRLDIPFVHVPDANAFAAFAEPGFVKVAWAMRAVPRGWNQTRLEFELRVEPTDEAAWSPFRRYYRVIGPVSRFIRRSSLAAIARELGEPRARENTRPLPGDELLIDAGAQATDSISIAAAPEKIWPWLVQMGCRRAGFYSWDVLDNGGVRSARELHPELAEIAVGDVLPATPDSDDGFEVLRVEPPHTLVLGGLFDPETKAQRPFGAERPARYWHVTWTFALEPLDAVSTRLNVRARAAFSEDARLHAAWIGPVHQFMQGAQLRNLSARVEGCLPRDDWRDVASGLSGSVRIALNLATPFLRRARSHWGLDATLSARSYPGDELIAEPEWGWTHAVEIEAPTDAVWGWVAQVGVERGGFYSYQWLENLVGCGLRNAERVHPEWELHEGEALILHPKVPPLNVVQVDRGRHLVAWAGADEAVRAAGEPWAEASWLFYIEPLAEQRCRLVSRFRSRSSGDFRSRAANGPTLLEPIGSAMDRRMLLGIKRRAEKRHPLARRVNRPEPDQRNA